MDEDERQRKLEAGRAKLASFRQKRAKNNGAGAAKKTQKRKGSTDPQNDGSAQDGSVDAAPPSANATELNSETGHEEPQKLEKSDVQQNQRQGDLPPTLKPILSPEEVLRDEELLALTGKDQLKQLQQAVEKRNDIIAKLSSNLQEALASRDQVQLEAQSLAGQIRALQRQLQQTSAEFLRIKSQSEAEALNAHRPQFEHGHCAHESDLNHRPPPSDGAGSDGPGSESRVDGFTANGETDSVLQKLRAELAEESGKSQRMCAELTKELEKHQHLLSLMEEEKKGWEEERQEKEGQLQDLHTQLSQVQSQCLEMQEHKEEKEKLNREVLELRKRFQEEEQDAERRFCEEVASFALRLQSLEEERRTREDEVQRLKEEHREELELVRQLLQDKENELKFREEEVMGLKASKNRQNQAKAGFSWDDGVGADEASLENGAHQDSMNASVHGDLMMERYFASVPHAQSHSSLVNESLGHCSQLDISAEHSFELKSEVFGDEHLLSISNRALQENDNVHSTSTSQCSGRLADNSDPECPSQWFHDSSSGGQDASKLSEQPFEETDLGKELLSQQCGELREELALKDRDLNVLREEVIKSAEELEEARSRWAQVTEELQQALWELEEEKERRRSVEEQINLKDHEQDNLKNKLGALMEQSEEKTGPGEEVAETSKLDPSVEEDAEEHDGELENDSACLKPSPEFGEDNQLQKLKAQCEQLSSELEETKTKLTAALTGQGALNQTLEELESTRAQVLGVQAEVERLHRELEESHINLDSAEREKSDLESQIFCLKQNLEQVLEEELEQFENLLKAKDVELAEEKEKWEEERQEKDKELVDLKQLMEEQRRQKDEEVNALLERLKTTHQQELKDLVEKHQQEVSELNLRLEKERLQQQARTEDEQRRQISLIKQVTEREHERVVSELTLRHGEELRRLKAELSLELSDGLEAAHQAELLQAEEQKTIELEALRLSLTGAHASQVESSQLNLQQESSRVQASLRETSAREISSLQARHQSAVEQLRQEAREQLETLREIHQQETNASKQEWGTRVAREMALMEEKQATEIQALRLQWEKEAEAKLLASLSETENSHAVARSELDRVSKALTEAQAALLQTQAELRESQAKLDQLHNSSKEEIQNLEEELKQALVDRDAAACSLETLVSTHKAVLQEKTQHILHLEEKEQQLQQELLHLQDEKTMQKHHSEEEVKQLWAQLESMRTSRQELGELKEQLLARSSRVDDIERLKTEFNEQKRGIKEQNEAELESLRRYFEQRLRATEESHREEIALLQLRLVEQALEESVLKTANDSFISQDGDENGKDASFKNEKHKELIDSLHVQLEEKHSVELAELQSSMTLSFEEEVQQVRSDLTDHYYDELQEKKTRHALQMEQLKAKLSEHHLREITRIHLEAARQVEAEVEQRLWRHTEDLQTRMTIIHTLENRLAALCEQHNAEIQKITQNLNEKHESEMTTLRDSVEERTCLEKALQEEKEKLKSLQAAMDNEESPQILMVKQTLEAQYGQDLQKEKTRMETEIEELTARFQKQSEEHQQKAQERLREEKASLEQHLVQKYEISLVEQKIKHHAELECERSTMQKKHSQEMEALDAKHEAQLDALGASHRDQLAAIAADFDSEHKAEVVALEAALGSKQTTDLERLDAAFRETSRAQLEALEADLTRKHQEERDALEKRLLGNMDTLEITYLKEVQILRDELVHQEERHSRALDDQKTEAVQITERRAADEASIREELRKELAQVHVEKFSAMAMELSHVHKTELAAQKEALDIEHCKALETLKKQVLELEQQHVNALHELSHTCSTEKEQLIQQHQLQLQELRGISARESEACRRELEEESSRQRQRFIEEAELLKVQSEERLQDRINLLKTEIQEQKEAELAELRRSVASEREKKEQSYMGKMSRLTAQLQKLDAVVAELRREIGCLQGELDGKRAEMETLETLLQRREREGQEGGNLLKMLTDDLQANKSERRKLDTANEKLSKLLIEVVRTTVETEELIGQKITARTKTPQRGSSTAVKDAEESGITVGDLTADDLELTQLFCESLLVSDGQICPEGEDAALNACGRLRKAVFTLLELLNQANTQLEQTHGVHLTLEEKLSQGREDTTQLFKQHTRLLEQLDQEAKLKSQLQLELHKAEGLLEGYVAEKLVVEDALQQKEAHEERLVEELEDAKGKLRQMESLTAQLEGLRLKHQELSEEHVVLLRQKDHLSAGLGEREKALLAETERLTQDRQDLQRQAERDHRSLSQRLRVLERDLEEQETKGLETEQHHKTHTDDLDQHVQALEKQLKHNRQFIEEQAVEREHERDEFQQEIRKLEARLRLPAGADNKGHRFEDLALQVESLQAVIKDKMEDHASLLTANQQAQRDLAERDEEIDKLAGRIRELEQALLNSAESNGLVGKLEQELHRAKLKEQELTQDKQALEQQQLSNRLQLSALQSKLDETRHCYYDNTRDPTQELREALDTAQESIRAREHEFDLLFGQVETVQGCLTIKEMEVKHLTLQLELQANQNGAHVNKLQEQIVTLQETVSALTILQEQKEERDESEKEREETLPSALLQEKNQEIDHLNNEILRLEQELVDTGDSKALEVELEDLSSQVEHLQSEIMRVRQDKEEEAERLHEVISTLQAELATLGPNLHEVSDSQDGDSINPSPAPSPEPHHFSILEQERTRGPSSLKQELSLTQAGSSRSLRSRLKAVQSQLETAVAEREGLQRLLLTQEQEYRGHGEEFGKMMKAEKEKTVELQGLLLRSEAELKKVRDEAEDERVGRNIQAGDAAVSLHEEKAHLSTLVAELKKREQERVRENEALKAKEREMKMEMNVLRETTLTLERQIQEVRAELVDMERLVAAERAKARALEATKEELSDDNEALGRKTLQLQEDVERLGQAVASVTSLNQNLSVQLKERQSSQEEAQRDVQTKDRVLAGLETDNRRLKEELRALQEDLAVHEEELAYQQGELQQLRQHWQQEDTLHHHPHQRDPQKDISHRVFECFASVSRDEASLSSPEVLRRLESSEDWIPERFHASARGSRMSDLGTLNATGPDLPEDKTSPRFVMEPPHSRTITPEPATQSSHSPCSASVSDHLSTLDSKMHELDGLDQTAPPSPLGSASSLSAPEWASDGYGSNVSSELGARLRAELEQTERLDAQFVEYLCCRGMNPTANTDSAAGSMSYSDDLLSPELQCLLKKVHQESCRILTLSQRRTTSFPQPHASDQKAFSSSQTQHHFCDGSAPVDHQDISSSHPPMNWQQEKRALQETVIALRELLCRMAQRNTQTDHSGEPDLQGDRARSDGHIESLLKAELEETNRQLKCAHETQREQNSRIQSLRLVIEEGQEALKGEQMRIQELQQQMEEERAHGLLKVREEEQRKEAINVFSEQKRSEVMALKGQVEQEKVICSNLRRELQIEQSRSELLEKRAGDTQRELEDARQRSAQQQELNLKEKSGLERLLTEAQSRLGEIHSKLMDAHRKLDEEKERHSRQVDELSRRHEGDAARDRKVLSDMREQLEQERRQGEELAAAIDKLRAEALQGRRKWEEEDRARREELQWEQEAVARHRVAMESLKEQKREVALALQAERERCEHQDGELADLKERLRLLKDKERERDEQWDRERRKVWQEQTERERRQEQTNYKLSELELLRKQDQQSMQELQRTLTELKSEERAMATQRLSGRTAGQHHKSPSPQHPTSSLQAIGSHAGGAQHNKQTPSLSSSAGLLEKLLSENSELTERVTSLSQERATLKHRLTFLERQLRRTEKELAQMAAETENLPLYDVTSNGKVQRLYGRYLRAESFRKALVYQKRYLLLLLGGFQECEQATLCLISHMGARPALSSQPSPLRRFRAAVRVVIAVSRMRFLTRKWQKAIRRLSMSGTVNGTSSGPKIEVLKQQQPISYCDSPPKKDTVLALVPPTKSPFRLHNRSYSSSTLASGHSAAASQDPERSLTEYINHLENVQHRLGGARRGSSVSNQK